MKLSPANSEDLQSGLRAVLLDKTRGSTDVLRLALDWLEAHPEALGIEQADRTMATLARTRPAMACFAVLARRMENAWRVQPDRTPQEIIAAMRNHIAEADRIVAEQSLAALTPLEPVQVVTTSCSSAVVRTLAVASHLISTLYVVRGKGADSMEEDLAERFRESLAVRLVAPEGLEAAVGQASAGLIGADTVFLDGAILNAAGSLALAERLNAQGKPLFVLASSWKRCDQRSTNRIVDPETVFDLIPASLITRLFTDK